MVIDGEYSIVQQFVEAVVCLLVADGAFGILFQERVTGRESEQEDE
jgi:hypothetical protein